MKKREKGLGGDGWAVGSGAKGGGGWCWGWW